MSSRVEGWMVSPRKSRRKSACFSRTSTGTPARASSTPAIMPAGPPPAMQQATERVSSAMCRSSDRAAENVASRAGLRRPRFEIGAPYLGIGQELGAGAREHDATLLHDIGAVRELEGVIG